MPKYVITKRFVDALDTTPYTFFQLCILAVGAPKSRFAWYYRGESFGEGPKTWLTRVACMLGVPKEHAFRKVKRGSK